MNNLNKVPLRVRLVNVYALLFILCGTLIIGSFVFLKSLEYLLHINLSSGIDLFKILDNHPNAHQYLLIAQALTALVSFIAIPLLVIFLIWPDLKNIFTINRSKFLDMLLLAIFITLASIPLIALLSEFNKYLIGLFPPSFKGIETWMHNAEKEAEKLTYLLAYYSNTTELIGGLIVIAVLPAIGEELLFRGIMQTQLTKAFLNPHLAIIITGFVFSFIHFQFLGFLPRMFLGVIFGYLFYWSGSIWIPIAMHFTNNALTYFALNFYKQKKVSVDLESTKDLPSVAFIIAAIFFTFLVYRFYKLREEQYLKVH